MSRRPRLPVVKGAAALGLAQGGCGGALLLHPGPLLRSLQRGPVDRRVITVARVLGIRQLVQGLMTVRRPTRRTLAVGAAVDATHAASMLAAATAGLGPRRLTVASAAAAGAFAGAGLAQSRRR